MKYRTYHITPRAKYKRKGEDKIKCVEVIALQDALKRLDTAVILLKETHPAEAGSIENFIEECKII